MNSTILSWLRFNTVGLIGVAIQLAVLILFKTGLGVNHLAATIIAVEAAVVHNFVWHERWTWAHRGLRGDRAFARFIRFNAGNGLISLGGNVFLMWLLVSRFQINYIVANLFAIGVCSLVNFLVSDRLVFRENP